MLYFGNTHEERWYVVSICRPPSNPCAVVMTTWSTTKVNMLAVYDITHSICNNSYCNIYGAYAPSHIGALTSLLVDASLVARCANPLVRQPKHCWRQHTPFTRVRQSSRTLCYPNIIALSDIPRYPWVSPAVLPKLLPGPSATHVPAIILATKDKCSGGNYNGSSSRWKIAPGETPGGFWQALSRPDQLTCLEHCSRVWSRSTCANLAQDECANQWEPFIVCWEYCKIYNSVTSVNLRYGWTGVWFPNTHLAPTVVVQVSGTSIHWEL